MISALIENLNDDCCDRWKYDDLIDENMMIWNENCYEYLLYEKWSTIKIYVYRLHTQLRTIR